MKAIVIASGENDRGVLLKRAVGETLLARAVRTARAMPSVRLVYGMTQCEEYAERFRAMNVLPAPPLDTLGSEPVICLDAHYPLVGPEIMEKAATVADILLCPVQSVSPVAEHPALSFETIETLQTERGVAGPPHVFSIDLAGSEEYGVVYWANVLAFADEDVVAGGWTEFSIPPYQETLAKPSQAANAEPQGFAPEIMVDVIVETRGGNAVVTVFWSAPEGSQEFSVSLHRTTCALSGNTKQYTVPGLMHSDPISGCLVNPLTGEKLINRQSHPPFTERCWALLAGTAKDVADILSGLRPRSLRGVCLTQDEATCVKHDLDILRLKRKLALQMTTERTPKVVSSESQMP
jgi:hypothetical protein